MNVSLRNQQEEELQKIDFSPLHLKMDQNFKNHNNSRTL